MENLNAEQVKKALECCSVKCSDSRKCPYGDKDDCIETTAKNALALINSQEQRIKKLTEEVALWKAIAKGYQNQFEDCAEDRAKLTEEKDRLRDTAYRLECEVHRERADTVKEMQEEIKKTLSALCKRDVSEIHRMIDQIAKEMSEGENNGS